MAGLIELCVVLYSSMEMRPAMGQVDLTGRVRLTHQMAQLLRQLLISLGKSGPAQPGAGYSRRVRRPSIHDRQGPLGLGVLAAGAS